MKALQIRRKVSEDFMAAFDGVNFILTPSTPSDPFPINAKLSATEMYLQDVMTIPASLAGLPAISVPMGLSKAGLPVGLQLIAPPKAEIPLLHMSSFLYKKETASLLPTLCK